MSSGSASSLEQIDQNGNIAQVPLNVPRIASFLSEITSAPSGPYFTTGIYFILQYDDLTASPIRLDTQSQAVNQDMWLPASRGTMTSSCVGVDEKVWVPDRMNYHLFVVTP